MIIHRKDSSIVFDDGKTRSPSFPPFEHSLSPFMPSSRPESPQHNLPRHPTPETIPRWYLRDDHMHDCPYHMDTCTGCGDLHSEDQSDDDIGRLSPCSSDSPLLDELASRQRSTTPTSVLSFHSPEATRVQLKEEFLRLYFPAGIVSGETDFMFSKFLASEALDCPGRAMDAAVDTLSLIKIGTAHDDLRLIHEARARYDIAVTTLNTDLEDPNAMCNDGVLGAAYILGFCEIFQALAQGREPWRTHHAGLRDTLLARGPSQAYSKFAQFLVYNFRHVAALVGSAERKGTTLARTDWKRCSALTDGLTAALSEQTIMIPSILEAADIAMQRPRKQLGELFTVLTRLTALERDMQTWLWRWYSSFEQQPYWQESMESLPHFRQYCVGAPEAFPKALRFPSFSQASAQVTYWIGLLQVKQTICEVNEALPHAILPKSSAMLEEEADEIAKNLCQSVAWLTQPQHGFCGVLRALGPLCYAARWHSKRVDLLKIAWCERICGSLEAANSISSLYHTSHYRIMSLRNLSVDDKEAASPIEGRDIENIDSSSSGSTPP